MRKNLFVTLPIVAAISLVFLICFLTSVGMKVHHFLPTAFGIAFFLPTIIFLGLGRFTQDFDAAFFATAPLFACGCGAFASLLFTGAPLSWPLIGTVLGLLLIAARLVDRTPGKRKSKNLFLYLLTAISFSWFIAFCQSTLTKIDRIVMGVGVLLAWALLIAIARRELRRDMAIMHGS